MPSSEKSVGIRSIWDTTLSTCRGAMSPGANIRAGMWYFSSGISVLPASPWFFPSLLLCISLGFAIDFLFACVAIELRGISWLAHVIRTAIVALFSGTVLPFRLLPFGLARVFELQPFGSLGGAPLALFVGTARPERILLAQVFWNLTLWPAAILWFCRSRERLVSFGG